MARLVEECTNLPLGEGESWHAQKRRYLEQLRGLREDAVLVAACDKLHNALSIQADYARCGESLWTRFTTGRDGALWYYHAISELFSTRKNLPPVRELLSVVAAVETATAVSPTSPAATIPGRNDVPHVEPLDGWRYRPSRGKDHVIEATRRRADGGGRDEQIVMAWIYGKGEALPPDPGVARAWLTRAGAEHLLGEIVQC